MSFRRQQDFSWDRSAREYVDLFEHVPNRVWDTLGVRYMKYFFYASAIFFILVGAAVLFTLLQKDESDSTPKEPDFLQEQFGAPSIDGPQIKIVAPADDKDFTAVEYRDDGFIPSSVELKQNETGLGCFLKVINRSSRELLLRLSPYDPEGRRGFSFSPVAPGESIKIDPRHGSLNPLSFHNRHDPSKEFSVTLDSTCFNF